MLFQKIFYTSALEFIISLLECIIVFPGSSQPLSTKFPNSLSLFTFPDFSKFFRIFSLLDTSSLPVPRTSVDFFGRKILADGFQNQLNCGRPLMLSRHKNVRGVK